MRIANLLLSGALALSLSATALAEGHGGGHAGGGGHWNGGGHADGGHWGGGRGHWDGGHWDHRGGWDRGWGWGLGLGLGLGWPYYGDPYWYGGWPYYNYAPRVYAAPAPVVEEPPVALAPQTPTWYYCDSPQGYYPYVQSCDAPWRPVPATPPAPQ